MEKVLIYENPVGSALEALKSIVLKANEVAEEYTKLNLGEFTLKAFKDIAENGTSNVKLKYISLLNDDIKKSNIKSPSFAASILSDADNVLKPLSASIQKLKSYSLSFSKINVHNVAEFSSFEEGRFSISDDNVEKLKDSFSRVYLETEEEAKAFATLKLLAETYTKLLSDLAEYNGPLADDLKRSCQGLDDFIKVKENKAELKLENMSYFLANYN